MRERPAHCSEHGSFLSLPLKLAYRRFVFVTVSVGQLKLPNTRAYSRATGEILWWVGWLGSQLCW